MIGASDRGIEATFGTKSSRQRASKGSYELSKQSKEKVLDRIDEIFSGVLNTHQSEIAKHYQLKRESADDGKFKLSGGGLKWNRSIDPADKSREESPTVMKIGSPRTLAQSSGLRLKRCQAQNSNAHRDEHNSPDTEVFRLSLIEAAGQSESVSPLIKHTQQHSTEGEDSNIYNSFLCVQTPTVVKDNDSPLRLRHPQTKLTNSFYALTLYHPPSPPALHSHPEDLPSP